MLSLLPKTLNLVDFWVSKIGERHWFRSSSELISDCKVAVYQNSDGNLSSNATDFTAIVLYATANLFGLRLNDGEWEFKGIKSLLWFKDIICFKGTIYAFAGKGKLYVIDHLTFRVTDIAVKYFICDHHSSIRLVGSDHELFLVVEDKFKAYKLNELQGKWETVETLGDRTMFLGSDGCFLVSNEDLLWHNFKGNFVISSSIMNSLKAKRIEVTGNLQIYISCLQDVGKKNLKSYLQAISSMLWPPPTWFVSEKSSPSRNSENQDEDLQLDFHSQPPSRPEEVPSIMKSKFQEQLGAFEQDSPEFVALTASKTLQTQSSGHDASVMKFHHINIQSHFQPIIEKVFAKHGDVLEGCAIRSYETKVMALDSLAKMVLILQGNSGKTLTEHQASYLDSTLSDLQIMHLKVDWLVPTVEKALALHRNRQWEAILSEIDKATVKAKEMEHLFLETIAEVKQELERDRKTVSEYLSVFGPLEGDKCLGEGLC